MKKSLIVLSCIPVFVFSLWLYQEKTSAQASCHNPNPAKGKATAKVEFKADASYRIWSRIKAASSSKNSYLLEINGCAYNVGDSSKISSSQWTWVDYRDGNSGSKIDVFVKKGIRTVNLYGRETDVRVDKLLFVSDKNCVPTGNGSNCEVSSSGTSSGAPSTSSPDSSDTNTTPNVDNNAENSDSPEVSDQQSDRGFNSLFRPSGMLGTDENMPNFERIIMLVVLVLAAAILAVWLYYKNLLGFMDPRHLLNKIQSYINKRKLQ